MKIRLLSLQGPSWIGLKRSGVMLCCSDSGGYELLTLRLENLYPGR
jgi:hypothetical protein